MMLQFQTLEVVSDGKVNILEVKSKHFPTVFKKIKKNKKKVTEKREFLRKTSFRLNRFFYMGVIQKLITVNTLNFYKMFMLVLLIYIKIFTKSVENAKIYNSIKILENLIPKSSTSVLLYIKIFTKSVENAKIYKIKNTTLIAKCRKFNTRSFKMIHTASNCKYHIDYSIGIVMISFIFVKGSSHPYKIILIYIDIMTIAIIFYVGETPFAQN
ncbi:hypothetical protein AGLY_017366 [Aphis glycines]|uniref:Uncharacterized protein n=1 Tax=Aphis glycines TaxID=307491 RepID=A0A6G0SV32_APHGL|nr:hypothetical protein AGLY_017366 [Aphis glycines]